MPELFNGLRVHFGLVITLILIFISWFIFSNNFGFQLKVSGLSIKGFAGLIKTNLLFLFYNLWGFAGLAGLGEVSGPIGLLYGIYLLIMVLQQ